MIMDELKKVDTLENEDEARLLESILTERAIPHLLRTYYDTAFDGLYQSQKGWGNICAPLPYHEEIKEILADLRREAEGIIC